MIAAFRRVQAFQLSVASRRSLVAVLALGLAVLGALWGAKRWREAQDRRVEALEAEVEELGGSLGITHPPGQFANALRGRVPDEVFDAFRRQEARLSLPRAPSAQYLVDFSNHLPIAQLTLHDARAIDDEALGTISKLSHLNSLSLTHAPITDAGLHWFRRMPELRRVRLIDTAITDAGVEALNNHPTLEWISAGGKGISAIQLESFRTVKVYSWKGIARRTIKYEVEFRTNDRFPSTPWPIRVSTDSEAVPSRIARSKGAGVYEFTDDQGVLPAPNGRIPLNFSIRPGNTKLLYQLTIELDAEGVWIKPPVSAAPP
jgi:hypothetical protein